MKLIKSMEELATHIGTHGTVEECLEEAQPHRDDAEAGLEMYKKHFPNGMHFVCVEFDNLAPELADYTYLQMNRMYNDMVEFQEGDSFYCPLSLVKQQICKRPEHDFPIFASIEGGIVAFVIDPRDHDKFLEIAKIYS